MKWPKKPWAREILQVEKKILKKKKLFYLVVTKLIKNTIHGHKKTNKNWNIA